MMCFIHGILTAGVGFGLSGEGWPEMWLSLDLCPMGSGWPNAAMTPASMNESATQPTSSAIQVNEHGTWLVENVLSRGHRLEMDLYVRDRECGSTFAKAQS